MRAIQVSVLLERLNTLLVRYVEQGAVPNLDSHIDLRLFNTLRSYLYPALYPRPLKLQKDARGELFEVVKADQGGQTFLSTTVPSATRGNHWHLRKIERFFVVSGCGTIRIRKLFSDEVQSFKVSGDVPPIPAIPCYRPCSGRMRSSILSILIPIPRWCCYEKAEGYDNCRYASRSHSAITRLG
jgi:UDP-2-acetamido-2,6-beta-L-arabino-hexul-4-ose reductase